ncbi:rhamnan synthesis F family protein [Microbacterium sp. LWH3-1.2]|uniref:rhamnan synthesis F family protein n=1 Tax=Microbacterium sp. LWH3-1.2 TaxID=3135256 RepID=UPI003424CD24
MASVTDALISSGQKGAPVRRVVVYALSRAAGGVDEYVHQALSGLRPHASRLVAIVPKDTAEADRARLAHTADRVLESTFDGFDPAVYPWAIDADGIADRADEIVLTGDSWFGPIGGFDSVLERMSKGVETAWAMIENAQGEPEAFPDEGFPAPNDAWLWTVVPGSAVRSVEWVDFWNPGRRDVPRERTERGFVAHLRSRGVTVDYAFPAADFPSGDPGLFTPLLLLDAGCPLIRRDVFTRYPPFLERFAIVGREIIASLRERGFPVDVLLANLSRTVPAKALNTVGGMLEVLPGLGTAYDPERPFRIAAVVHVSDLEGVDEILERLRHLPSPYDLFLTTTDGKRATLLQRIVEQSGAGPASFDVRVTPANRGRDMSDFFVGCRDVLLDDSYDLVVKVHSRRARQKTVNLRRYFRRYQLENLLDSRGHVEDLLALFQAEPGLGFVFPPMMHIGYSAMGSAWGGYRDDARELCAKLGIHVPLDVISPLAPFGAMWIGRPEALRMLTRHRWRYGDYRSRNPQRYRALARVQERLIATAGAELGYHTRTVLTPEHAAISHTALESKADELFAMTRGWPVEQIRLMHRAGFTGHGGVVALSRMYVRLNHPRAAAVLMPLYELAFRSFVAIRVVRSGARGLVAMLRGRPTEGTV